MFDGLACIRHDPVSQSYVKHDLKSNDGTPQIKLLPDRCDLLSDVVEPVWLFSLLFGTPASLSLYADGEVQRCVGTGLREHHPTQGTQRPGDAFYRVFSQPVVFTDEI